METKRLFILLILIISCTSIRTQATIQQQNDNKYVVGSWIRTDTDEGKTTAIWTFKFHLDGTTDFEQATGFGENGKPMMNYTYKGTYYYNHLKKEFIIYLDGDKEMATKFTVTAYTPNAIKLLYINENGEKEYHVLNRIKANK